MSALGGSNPIFLNGAVRVPLGMDRSICSREVMEQSGFTSAFVYCSFHSWDNHDKIRRRIFPVFFCDTVPKERFPRLTAQAPIKSKMVNS
jgi:hypothetical protein